MLLLHDVDLRGIDGDLGAEVDERQKPDDDGERAVGCVRILQRVPHEQPTEGLEKSESDAGDDGPGQDVQPGDVRNREHFERHDGDADVQQQRTQETKGQVGHRGGRHHRHTEDGQHDDGTKPGNEEVRPPPLGHAPDLVHGVLEGLDDTDASQQGDRSLSDKLLGYGGDQGGAGVEKRETTTLKGVY